MTGRDPLDAGGDPACWADLLDGVPDGAVTDDGARREVVVDTTVAATGTGGAVWSLPHGGDLDANLVRLAAADAIGEHVNAEVDVVVVVVEGVGELTVEGRRHRLRVGTIAVVPHGVSRGIVPGADGLAYVTVHRRRGPLSIRSRP